MLPQAAGSSVDSGQASTARVMDRRLTAFPVGPALPISAPPPSAWLSEYMQTCVCVCALCFICVYVLPGAEVRRGCFYHSLPYFLETVPLTGPCIGREQDPRIPTLIPVCLIRPDSLRRL